MSGAEQCRLLAGPAAVWAQAVLALLAFGSLVYKRHRERPQRALEIWALDVSKQVVSMFAAHVCGMLIALLAHHSSTQSSECAWYFVAYTFDTTLGLGLTVAFHKTVIRFAKCWKKRHAARLTVSSDRWFDIVAQCGDYGEPPSLLRWWIQMVEWVLCVVGARAVCGTLVIVLGPVLVHAARLLDWLFQGHPTLLLFAVMIICPLLMNMIQVLIQDAILMWRRGGPGAGGEHPQDAAKAAEQELLLEDLPPSR